MSSIMYNLLYIRAFGGEDKGENKNVLEDAPIQTSLFQVFLLVEQIVLLSETLLHVLTLSEHCSDRYVSPSISFFKSVILRFGSYPKTLENACYGRLLVGGDVQLLSVKTVIAAAREVVNQCLLDVDGGTVRQFVIQMGNAPCIAGSHNGLVVRTGCFLRVTDIVLPLVSRDGGILATARHEARQQYFTVAGRSAGYRQIDVLPKHLATGVGFVFHR